MPSSGRGPRVAPQADPTPDQVEIPLLECCQCGEQCPPSHTRMCDGLIYCLPCFENFIVECSGCGALIHARDLLDYRNGGSVCRVCQDQQSAQCDICETILPERGEYCDSCSTVQNSCYEYSYKPTPRFAGVGPVYCGFEIEMECTTVQRRHEALSTLRDADIHYLYAKQDSSISCGFELVSQPASYDMWCTRREELTLLLKALSAAGATAWRENTCGMHIHVSREPLSTLHIYKLLRFVYQNQEFLTRISGRVNEASLDRWAAFDGCPHDAVRKAKRGFGDRKYEAINLQNATTIEFRLFQSSLNSDRVYRNLELVKALLDFTKQAGFSQLTGAGLWVYVDKNRKLFPGLAARYLKEGKSVPARCE